jgi:hypothetical protein
MAPLISMIIEAGEALRDWEQEAGDVVVGSASGVDACAINGAANWDLCTLAVFTCSTACSAAASNLDEECVVLVNEDACQLEEAA